MNIKKKKVLQNNKNEKLIIIKKKSTDNLHFLPYNILTGLSKEL